jgi:hypothetical protein
MHTANMAVEVFLAGKPFAGLSAASKHWALQLFRRTAVPAMNLALVSTQATGVCEASELATFSLQASIRSAMLV